MMANTGHPAYRPNLNRNPTKKWTEAQAAYGDDDWDDDDGYGNYGLPAPESVSAGPQRQPGWGQRNEQVSQRNFTNPSLAGNYGRPSFDRGDERRYFSTGGYDAAYQGRPTTLRTSDQDMQDFPRGFSPQAPTLQMNIQDQHPDPATQLTSQQITQTDTHGASYSAVGHHPQPLPINTRAAQQHSSSPIMEQGTREVEPIISTAGFLPRKSSLSQQQYPAGGNAENAVETLPNPLSSKPLPFIRPADIYKRMEEEREKERLSQDSGRPDFDAAAGRMAGRVTSSPARSVNTPAVHTTNPAAEEAGEARHIRSDLEFVIGREGGHGLSSKVSSGQRSSIVAAGNQTVPISGLSPVDVSGRPKVSRAASSVYTERPDPTSATSVDTHPFNPSLSSASPHTAESYRESVLQYSPSSNRHPDLYTEHEHGRGDEEFPNFDRATSIKSTASKQDSSVELSKDTQAQTETGTSPKRSQILQHQTYLGPKQSVQQAFDSGHNDALSIPNFGHSDSRSDVANTILATEAARGAEGNKSPNSLVRSIEAPTVFAPSHDRSESVATIKAQGQDQDNTILPATTFVPDYKRDTNTLVSDVSRTHRPFGIETTRASDAQLSALPATTALTSLALDQSVEKLPATQHNPTASSHGSQKPMKWQTDLSLPPMSRTESEDWQDWQAQRRSFHAKHGIENSSTDSPARSSPVSRSESPVKGTVRNIADKLETKSGRSSPALVTRPHDQSFTLNKPANLRNESFRPALPGAWQSYTTTASDVEQLVDTIQSRVPAHLNEQSRTESTESIPTATAPRQWQNSHDSTADAAFAAAAAAGKAMAGAFSGSASTQNTSHHSETTSDEANTPVGQDLALPETSETRDFASGDKSDHATVLAASPAKHQPDEMSSASEPATKAIEPPNTNDFPAPLRTSKSIENKHPSPRLSIPPTARGTDDQDPEQLQHDIVQSLTPKSTAVETSAHDSQPTRTIPRETPRQFSIISDDGEFIAREYGSYWSNEHIMAEPIETADESVAMQAHSSETEPLETEQHTGLAPDVLNQTSARGNLQQNTWSSAPTSASIETSQTSEINMPQSLQRRESWESRKQEDHQKIEFTSAASATDTHHEEVEKNRSLDARPAGAISHDDKYSDQVSDSVVDGNIHQEIGQNLQPSGSVFDKHLQHANIQKPNLLGLDLAKGLYHEDKSESKPPLPEFDRGIAHGSDQQSRPLSLDAARNAPHVDSQKSEPQKLDFSGSTVHQDGQRRETEGPELAGGIAHERPATPKGASEPPSSTQLPPIPRIHDSEELPHDLTSSNTVVSQPPAVSPVRPVFPQEKVDFRNILSFKDSSQRIKAFDENRTLYAEPTGLLDQWITSMNTSEHTDVFHSSRAPRQLANAGSVDARPSPRRDAASASGTKQMQEDGKRLLAAAGKYGGKAGTAARGFFSRGKDKLRSTSYGEKVQSHNRRKSSITSIDTPSIAPSREPVLTERAPQLPTPSLDTPAGETSWSQFSQMFQARPGRGSPVSPPSTILSAATMTQPGIVSQPDVDRSNEHHAPNSSLSKDRPPASVIASFPAGQNVPVQSQQFPNFGIGTKVGNAAKPLRGTDSLQHNTRLDSQEGRINDGRERQGSLPVPRPRRTSSVSEVSEISAPPEEAIETITRTISPAVDSQQRAPKGIPIIPPQVKKEEELSQNQDRKDLMNTDPLLRASMEAASRGDRLSHVEIGAPIEHIANLMSLEFQQGQRAESRPFSFVGNETLNHAMSQQHMVNLPAEVVGRSPVEDDLPIDPEKTPQPNITEHPAYRNSDHEVYPVDELNPLPSSRRSPQGGEQDVKQQQRFVIPDQSSGEDGGYRIPGPYVQEYRSPRSVKLQGSMQSPGTHRPSEQSPDITSPASNRHSASFERQAVMRAPSQVESRQEPERSKSRGFGAMFRTRSKSPSKHNERWDNHSPTRIADQVNDEGKIRKAFFSLNNRPLSPTRRDDSGRVTPLGDGGRSRKLSMDILRPSKPTSESRKKRSSGFGALFGMSSGKDKDYHRHARGASIPYSPSYSHNTRVNDNGPGEIQYPASAIEPRYLSRNQVSDVYSQQPRVKGTDGGQYGLASSGYQDTRAHFEPEQQHLDRKTPTANELQRTMDSNQAYGHESRDAVPTSTWSTNMHQASTIDHPRAKPSTPSIPTTRANRDISYGQNRPYIPPTTSRVQHGAKAELTQNSAYVKNLHTRSRSPRLGRPPSDEHLGLAYDAQDGGHPAGHRSSLDPASKLGTFSNKKLSPGGAEPRSEEEQEKPWTIGLPGGGEEDSDGDRAAYSQHNRYAVQPSQVPPVSHVVSPTTPYPIVQREHTMDTVSPVTAGEPRYQGIRSQFPVRTDSMPRHSIDHQRISHNHTGMTTDQDHAANVEPVSVPPSISNAAQVALPTSQSPETSPKVAAKAGTISANPPNRRSDQTSREPRLETTEHAPMDTQALGPTSSKPLTVAEHMMNERAMSPTIPGPLLVAEQTMGAQQTNQGTVPEHLSTTSLAHSSTPVDTHQKSPIASDDTSSIAAVTNSSTSGTTVTTTTVRSGSNYERNNIKTSTYIIDPETRLRQETAAGSVRNRSGTTNINTVQSNESALTPTNANTNRNLKIQTPASTNDMQTSAKTTTYGKSFDAVELPGSRPDGYESEEEVVMSATTYPGQEWMPDYAELDSDS